MSNLAIIFILETIGDSRFLGGCITSCNTPSILNLTLSSSSSDSIWISLALSSIACFNIRFTISIAGELSSTTVISILLLFTFLSLSSLYLLISLFFDCVSP